MLNGITNKAADNFSKHFSYLKKKNVKSDELLKIGEENVVKSV